jgi:hypothetical protein
MGYMLCCYIDPPNQVLYRVTWNPGDTMGVSGHGSYFCLLAVCACSARARPLTVPWVMPPTASTMKIEQEGACLHLSSELCLVSRPTHLVGCRISQRLSLSLLSRLRLVPWPPPFIMPQPFAAPLSFGWLLRCPSASTPILLQLCLVPWPPPLVDPSLVTVFGVVCHRSHRRICPVRRHLPQSRRPLSIAVPLSPRRASVTSVGHASLLPLPRAPLCTSFASAGSPPPLPAVHAHHKGVAPRREQVRVNDVHVPGTPLELGQKASCVSQL